MAKILSPAFISGVGDSRVVVVAVVVVVVVLELELWGYKRWTRTTAKEFSNTTIETYYYCYYY